MAVAMVQEGLSEQVIFECVCGEWEGGNFSLRNSLAEARAPRRELATPTMSIPACLTALLLLRSGQLHLLLAIAQTSPVFSAPGALHLLLPLLGLLSLGPCSTGSFLLSGPHGMSTSQGIFMSLI